MSMSKSNSKGKSLGPLFRKKGEGGLKAFEFEIPTGSYLYSGGWARSSQAIQPMVAHVKSDLLLEKKSWRFLATTYSRIVMITL